jgi:hypothetical protein
MKKLKRGKQPEKRNQRRKEKNETEKQTKKRRNGTERLVCEEEWGNAVLLSTVEFDVEIACITKSYF